MSDEKTTIVVIGFNEADRLHDCLLSAVAARDAGHASEIMYVDGGSTDESRTIAESYAVDAILGSSVQRSAAVNRNVGWRHASGALIQFLDADMVLDRWWLPVASARLNADPDCAVVCGEIHERQQSLWARVFQLDWRRTPGPIAYCGGAALIRRSALEAVDGFPEDVAYGEEPLLCWRIRNNLGQTIEYSETAMVSHDLAFARFGDYWRRCKRVGETQASIAARCWNTPDPLWKREVVLGPIWIGIYLAAILLLVIGSPVIRAGVVVAGTFLLIRKLAQTLAAGQSALVSIAYSMHTYFAKIPIGLGIVGWWLRRPHVGSKATPRA